MIPRRFRTARRKFGSCPIVDVCDLKMESSSSKADQMSQLSLGLGEGKELCTLQPSISSSSALSPSSSNLSLIFRPSRFSVGKKEKSESAVGGTGGKKSKDKKKASKSSSNVSSPSPQMDTACLDRVSIEVLREWETSFNSLLKHPEGLEYFENFLKSEFSEENIQFWKACERFKTVPEHMIEKEATIIYDEYISSQAPKLVNIDHQTTREIVENMKRPDHNCFLHAQQSIYLLMARDSFVRFVKSEQFQSALKR